MGNRDKNKIYFYKLQSGSVSQLIKYENGYVPFHGTFFMLIFNVFASCWPAHRRINCIKFEVCNVSENTILRL